MLHRGRVSCLPACSAGSLSAQTSSTPAFCLPERSMPLPRPLRAVDACCSLCQGTLGCTLFAWCQADAARWGAAAGCRCSAAWRWCMHPGSQPRGRPVTSPWSAHLNVPVQLPEHPGRWFRRRGRGHFGVAGPKHQRCCGAAPRGLPTLQRRRPRRRTGGQGASRAALELWLPRCADSATPVARIAVEAACTACRGTSALAQIGTCALQTLQRA